MIAILLIVSMLVLQQNVQCQNSDSNEIVVNGRVRVHETARYKKSVVQIRTPDLSRTFVTTGTNVDGDYDIDVRLPQGWYKLVFSSPECKPLYIPILVSSNEHKYSIDVKLTPYAIKDTSINFIILNEADSIIQIVKPERGAGTCWSYRFPCTTDIRYQVLGDELETRSHCPTKFDDFAVDRGGDWIGVVRCREAFVTLEYCASPMSSQVTNPEVHFEKPTQQAVYDTYVGLEKVMASLRLLRDDQKVSEWYDQANANATIVGKNIRTETNQGIRLQLLKAFVEYNSIKWFVKKDKADSELVHTVDEELGHFPSTWGLGLEGALPTFAFITSSKIIRKHTLEFCQLDNVDDEYKATVIAFLYEVYVALQDSVESESYRSMLISAYLGTNAYEGFQRRFIKNESLIGRKAIDIPGTDSGEVKQGMIFPRMNGKYVLLDFWATWCKPCIENIQYLQSLEGELDQLGVEINLVAIDDTHERVRNFVKKNRLHWTSILIDKSMSIPVKRYYNAEAIPQSILVSPAGLIVQAGSSLRNPGLLETLRKVIGR